MYRNRKNTVAGVAFLVVAAIVIGIVLMNYKPNGGGNNGSANQEDQIDQWMDKGGNDKKAVWISYLEFNDILLGKTKGQYEKNVDSILENMGTLKLNTAVVQVRPYGDALYRSAHFPWSYYCTGTQGKDPGFDPLKVFIEKAKGKNMKVEAWVNPYRIKVKDRNWPLSKDNPVAKDKSLAISWDGGLYYDPSSEKARELIVNGVKEIAQNYEVSAIHFDDYFYPTSDKGFDKTQYNNYKKSGGKLSLDNYRREQVTKLVEQVYKAVKEVNASVEFGISPQGNNTNNHSGQYADIKKWVQKEGYVDYIAPQIYWGFEHDTAAFDQKVKEWEDLVTCDKVKLYIGIGAYRIGEKEEGAGSGEKEWVNHSDVLARQVKLVNESKKTSGFILYRYDSLFNPEKKIKNHCEKELNNLKDVLTK